MTIYSLTYSFPYLEPVCCSMSSSNCCFLTCIQTSQEAGQVVGYSHLFQIFPQFVVIHTVKGFSIVNKAEIDVFLEVSWFFDNPADVGNLISGSSAFSKTSLNIWKFMVHVLLKPGLENFGHYFTSMWDECNCAVVWAFFGIAFLWDWNENWPFPVLWPLLSFTVLTLIKCLKIYQQEFSEASQLSRFFVTVISLLILEVFHSSPTLGANCCPNGLGVSNKNENRTWNLVQWIRGHATSIGLRCRVLSESSFYS